MSTEHNRVIVLGYIEEVLNKGNLAKFDDYFAGDVVFNGKKGFRQQLERMLLSRLIFPDLHLIVEDQVAEGDRVVTRVTFCGTHQGAYQGVPPTGRQVTWRGICFDRIAGGKVIEMWHESDDMSMLKQLSGNIE